MSKINVMIGTTAINRPELHMNVMPDCETYGKTVPSIRIGSATNSDIENLEEMYRINLKEHATIPEILEYVDETKPKNVIIDNSGRGESSANPNNPSYFADKIKGVCNNVILLPGKHPNAT